jgi:hypothetical protein
MITERIPGAYFEHHLMFSVAVVGSYLIYAELF